MSTVNVAGARAHLSEDRMLITRGIPGLTPAPMFRQYAVALRW